MNRKVMLGLLIEELNAKWRSHGPLYKALRLLSLPGVALLQSFLASSMDVSLATTILALEAGAVYILFFLLELYGEKGTLFLSLNGIGVRHIVFTRVLVRSADVVVLLVLPVLFMAGPFPMKLIAIVVGLVSSYSAGFLLASLSTANLWKSLVALGVLFVYAAESGLVIRALCACVLMLLLVDSDLPHFRRPSGGRARHMPLRILYEAAFLPTKLPVLSYFIYFCKHMYYFTSNYLNVIRILILFAGMILLRTRGSRFQRPGMIVFWSIVLIMGEIPLNSFWGVEKNGRMFVRTAAPNRIRVVLGKALFSFTSFLIIGWTASYLFLRSAQPVMLYSLMMFWLASFGLSYLSSLRQFTSNIDDDLSFFSLMAEQTPFFEERISLVVIQMLVAVIISLFIMRRPL